MAAKVQILQEKLDAVIDAIAAAKAIGNPTEQLEKRESEIREELAVARRLLTEGSEGKILRG